jgi:MFS family permease
MALSNPEVWKVGFYWFLVNVTMGSFLTWGPSLFMEFKELSLIYASSITSISMIMPSIFMPVFGLLSDRLGKRKIFLIIAASSWVILLPLMALSTGMFELILLVVFFGSLAAFMPVCSYALVAEVLGPAKAGAGFGILSFCGSMSSILGSPITGYVWDITGSLLNTFSFIVVFSAAGAIVAALLKTR